jgi:VWFA-related protein
LLAAIGSVLAAASGRLVARKPRQSSSHEAAQGKNQAFQLSVERNEVVVRVVALDSDGKAVRGLSENDFLLFDNGKQQVISGFSTQGRSAPAEAASAPGTAKPAPGAEAARGAQAAGAAGIPNQYVALYYDDLWMPFSNVVYTREAAKRYLDTEVKPDDRVGIFTATGQGDVDFTADREKLDQALAKLRPRSMEGPSASECPPLTDYEAYLINHEEVPLGAPSLAGPGRGGGNEFAVPSVMPEIASALGVAIQQVIQCACGGDPSHCPHPELTAQEAARMHWSAAEYQIRISLGTLDRLVERMALLPGRRTILFISPGFVDLEDLPVVSGIIDRAVQEGVVINGLDSRGLVARVPGGGASDNSKVLPIAYGAQLEQLQRTADTANSDVMAALAEGTGGTFFHDNNDFDQGFREAGGLPQFAYVLAFSPSDLKDNGAYHRLKVKLRGAAGRGLTVEARKGYYAPKKSTDAAVQAAEEIHEAVFSRKESQGLPLHVETRFTKTGQDKADLTVTLHLGGHGLNFQKEGSLYVDHLTSVTAIFDGNGLYVEGTEKNADIQLPEHDLKRVRKEGLRLQLGFALPPGNYLVRNVIRDSNGELAAVSHAVRISF